jgi:hypothetical protein
MQIVSNNVNPWDIIIQAFPVLVLLFVVIVFLYFVKNILND